MKLLQTRESLTVQPSKFVWYLWIWIYFTFLTTRNQSKFNFLFKKISKISKIISQTDLFSIIFQKSSFYLFCLHKNFRNFRNLIMFWTFKKLNSVLKYFQKVKKDLKKIVLILIWYKQVWILFWTFFKKNYISEIVLNIQFFKGFQNFFRIF